VSDELTLAREFPTPTREQWRQLVDTVLKGADFDRKLVTTTTDGIAIQPLYTADDVAVGGDESGFPGFVPHTRGDVAPPHPHGAWDVRVPMVHPDPVAANRLVLDELHGGASSVALRFDRAARRGIGPFGADYDLDGAVDGVCIHSADELDRALDGVYLDLAPIALTPGASFVAAAGWLRDVWRRRGVGGAEVAGSFGADPLGTLAVEGLLPQGLDGAMADAIALAVDTRAATPNVRAIGLDVGAYVEAGGSPVQQLAVLLATGAEMLRAGDAVGVSPTDLAAQIEATIVLDADVFAGIATVRAARRVWDAMLAACDVPGDRRGLRLQARTAARMMTRRDPWVNLLRVTAATFAAGVGGADGVIALPFDVELGFPNELGRRMARNTQLLLIEESHVGRVLDPGGGSYYVEAHTEELASRAWELFGEIERGGGMAAALLDGTIAARLADTWSQRIVDLARRVEPITGVSEFPFLEEAPVVREPLDVAAIRGAASGDETHVAPGPATKIDALPAHRSAERIEALRDASDAFVATHGDRPRVFLANLGPVASHTARATWALNFYEAGGIEAVTNDGFATADEVAAAFTESGATIACLCSSDAVYAELAETTAKALKAAGAARVELAGKPGDAADAYRTAGIDDFVHVGIDQIEHLRTVQNELGVTE
jgi:methylmalonyl-CoA mutase